MRKAQAVRWSALLLLVVGLALVAAGCGSSSSSSTSGTTGGEASSGSTEAEPGTSEGGGGNPAVVKAEEAVAQYSAEQPPIEIPPLSKKPPEGIHVAALTCPNPVCNQEVEGIEQAAKELGWTVTSSSTPYTSEGYIQTWNKILEEKPDAIAYFGLLPDSAIKAQLAEAAAAKIPVITFAPNGSSANPSGPPQAAITSTPVFEKDGELMADAIVADSGGSGKAVFVLDPTFSFFLAEQKSFDKVIEEAGGTSEELKIASAEIGKGVPTAIASYLQSHPEIEYAAPAVNDYTLGLNTALKEAGLYGKVKVISRAPSAPAMTEIANGEQWASVADENIAAGWRITDAIARVLVGDPLKPCCFEPDGWHQIFTEENATPEQLPATPGIPDSFLKAWNVG